ncbi:Dipeptidyl aminopeptidase BI [Seminavis robusta]|uniref:Prolyl endopeptidase n=1 Tax=Seminavis robusta TaxID=568900 RepID=A0A9N8E9Y2_9STRA|nr:Dipeptidyl aminopeptidase BI [Seminavis robusta]|eukprot:Sro818_g206980.1 Dipeptidyl aminopeptidase BI (768) ;mRNA; r:33990-36679
MSTATASKLSPPVARREEDRVVYAGAAPPGWDPKIVRQAESSKEKLLDPPVPVPDPYGWMRDDDRKNEEILDHLKKENEYSKGLTKHLEGLRQTLYDSMLSSIVETDCTVPRPNGDFYVYCRTFKGKSYDVICRAPRNKDKPLQTIEWDGTAESHVLPGEEVYLDVNVLAEGKEFCSLGAAVMSPSKKLLAYSVDFSGDETYELHVISLETQEEIFCDPKLIISGSLEWGQDDSNIFYLTMDETKRPYRMWRKWLLSSVEDELLDQEDDPQFSSDMFKTRDKRFVFLEKGSRETSEAWFIDLEAVRESAGNKTKLECLAPRRYRTLYDVDYRSGYWWITSKRGEETPNMCLFTAPAMANCQDEWKLLEGPDGKPLFDGGYDRALHGVSTFESHVVAHGREGGIPRVWIMGMDGGTAVSSFEALTFDEEAYDSGLSGHYEYNTDTIMVWYDSLITPTQWMEISLANLSERVVVKQKNVPNYKKEEYDCDRYLVTARDGSTQIPVLRVYRKDAMEEHQASGKPLPTHLYGYGSYGACEEAEFATTRLELLRRGMVYVIAQIRGGGEMGRQWYEEPNGAKYLCKKNTFNDFVDVARDLVDGKKLTTPDLLSCEGCSAGGMLIGATINQAPELFKFALMGVPFVDVICTMIDSSIPLTTDEWEEWGNVNEEKYFKYMMEYAPMQNVKEGAKYPTIFMTCGLHDSRVPYWEPCKLAATLRHKQSAESGSVCVKVEMSAGHYSASDRYKFYRELAFDYAYLLDQLGLADTQSK